MDIGKNRRTHAGAADGCPPRQWPAAFRPLANGVRPISLGTNVRKWTRQSAVDSRQSAVRSRQSQSGVGSRQSAVGSPSRESEPRSESQSAESSPESGSRRSVDLGSGERKPRPGVGVGSSLTLPAERQRQPPSSAGSHLTLSAQTTAAGSRRVCGPPSRTADRGCRPRLPTVTPTATPTADRRLPTRDCRL